MKRAWTRSEATSAGRPTADVDVTAALSLARGIPLLSVNLNNYKHPSNPVLSAGKAGEWDESGIARVVVIRLRPDDWRMWYGCREGKTQSIGLATSKDGVSWSKYPGNPVFVPTETWEGGFFSPTSVLHVNGLFHLYYWTPGHVFPDPKTGELPRPNMKYICLATSKDGIAWERRGSLDGRAGAVLGPEPAGINEDSQSGGGGVDAAKVFFFPEERSKPWKMIYTAFGMHGQWNGLAESEDGVVWRKVKAPLANHSGFYTRATGNHHNCGHTIRCPVRIGSIWAGLSYELDSRDCAPSIGLSLDTWVTLGFRSFYGNQDYEGEGLHPWAMEADTEWFYLYYDTNRVGLGLIKIPKRSAYQPVVVWENQAIGAQGAVSKIVEPDTLDFALQLESDTDGQLAFLAWNPVVNEWVAHGAVAVTRGILTTIDPLPKHAKLRLKFIPVALQSNVSAWLVPTQFISGQR